MSLTLFGSSKYEMCWGVKIEVKTFSWQICDEAVYENVIPATATTHFLFCNKLVDK